MDKCAAQSVDYIITLTTNDIVPLLTPCVQVVTVVAKQQAYKVKKANSLYYTVKSLF